MASDDNQSDHSILVVVLVGCWGNINLSTISKTGKYSTAKGHQRIYDD